jgi:predicted DNA-binding transcriptional regulator AlpA
MSRRVNPNDLLDTDQVAKVLGLGSANAVRVYARRYRDFPAPILQRRRCVFWLRQDVDAWRAGRRA